MEWISINEQLPEINERVFLAANSGAPMLHVCIGRLKSITTTKNADGVDISLEFEETPICAQNSNIFYDVVYWSRISNIPTFVQK